MAEGGAGAARRGTDGDRHPIGSGLPQYRRQRRAHRLAPELDIPAEIERREVRLKAIAEARERLEKRQRDGDIERGRSDDDDRKPRDEDGKPKGGRYTEL